MKKSLKRLVAMMLTLVMALGVCSPVMAAANAGTATITYKMYESGESEPVEITDPESVDVTEGLTVYDVVKKTADANEFAFVEEDGIDLINKQPTKYIKSMLGYTTEHVSGSEHNGSGTSIDWGWTFTVNGEIPTFAGEPNHYMAMNQCPVKANDEIEVVYALVKTEWTPTTTTFTILNPATIYS